MQSDHLEFQSTNVSFSSNKEEEEATALRKSAVGPTQIQSAASVAKQAGEMRCRLTWAGQRIQSTGLLLFLKRGQTAAVAVGPNRPRSIRAQASKQALQRSGRPRGALAVCRLRRKGAQGSLRSKITALLCSAHTLLSRSKAAARKEALCVSAALLVGWSGRVCPRASTSAAGDGRSGRPSRQQQTDDGDAERRSAAASAGERVGKLRSLRFYLLN